VSIASFIARCLVFSLSLAQPYQVSSHDETRARLTAKRPPAYQCFFLFCTVILENCHRAPWHHKWRPYSWEWFKKFPIKWIRVWWTVNDWYSLSGPNTLNWQLLK